MPRPISPTKPLTSIALPEQINTWLRQHCLETNQSLTNAICSALTLYKNTWNQQVLEQKLAFEKSPQKQILDFSKPISLFSPEVQKALSISDEDNTNKKALEEQELEEFLQSRAEFYNQNNLVNTNQIFFVPTEKSRKNKPTSPSQILSKASK